MSSLSFPDVNVWLAMTLTDHVHSKSARQWWNNDRSKVIAFSRFTQVGVLRLLTTAAVMAGRPLTMKGAWTQYDRFFADDRVTMVGEPPSIEAAFRRHSSAMVASPKVWADAYLLAMAQELGATLITFDRGLARRSATCLLLTGDS